MFVDARRVPRDHMVEADVCIVGAGPAGLAVARELAGRDLRVCVLESGGAELDADTQALAGGRVSGGRFEPLADARRRQLGGSANQWDPASGAPNHPGCRIAPLAAVDFEARDWLLYSGWPFGRAELDPYYERARRTLGLGPGAPNGAAGEDGGARPLPLDAGALATETWSFVDPERLAKALPAEVADAPNVQLYLWANVVEIETAESGGEVTAVHVACLSGSRFRVKARLFVLAAGGIENARLLLLSDRVQSGGIGNGYNVVGRFFMDHQRIHAGTLRPARRSLIGEMALYDVREVGGTRVTGRVVARDALLRREQLLGASVSFVPKHARYQSARQSHVDSALELARGAARFRLPANAGGHLRNVVRGIDYVGARAGHALSGGRLWADFTAGPDPLTGGGWSAGGDAAARFSVLAVHLQAEQAPHPENRVFLDDRLDALGCRTTHLHWLWRERDFQSAARFEGVLADGLRRAGVGELGVASDGERPVLESSSVRDHMGATRMHPNPKYGVVDADCRVHGVTNLFIAGSSVFPTGGSSDSTLTVLALALRLADHVKRVVAGRPAPAGAAAAAR
jgi:choline dehydrogenase-like flavoprotein